VVCFVVVLVLRRFSSSVKCRHEHDVVALLHLVLVLAFQFPVCFVDEDQYTGPSGVICQKALIEFLDKYSHCVVQNKQLLPRVLHDMIAKMSHEESNICRRTRLILSGQGEVVLLLVGEEDLKAAAARSQLNAF
jgi:hypothetical protein